MEEVRGNLWSYMPNASARVITTNGFVKQNGEAVMGRGCAAEAARTFPLLPRDLGHKIKSGGNHVFVFRKMLGAQGLDFDLVTFPTKNHWADSSDIDLIFRSACELADEADFYGWGSVIMPRPGCGNGNLEWDEVRPTIKGILDHRFYVITFD